MSDLKPHNPLLPSNQQGLYGKFYVNRVDGSDQPGGKHDGCDYFVLDLTHDVHAKAAMLAYAAACTFGHPELAEDLRAKFANPNDFVNALGVKPNGETVFVGKVPMPPRMKAHDLISELIGRGDFDDESSDHAMWEYAFQQYGQFLIEQLMSKG